MSWWTACSRMLKYVGRAFYRYQADGQGPLTVSVEDVTLSKVDSPLYMSHGAIFLLSCADIYIPDIIPRFCNPNSVPLRMLCPLYSGSKDAKWRNWPSGHALWSLAWIESSYLYSMTMTASVVCMGACSPFLVPGHIFTPPTHIHTHTHLQTHLNTYISSTSTTSTRTCWTSRSSR